MLQLYRPSDMSGLLLLSVLTCSDVLCFCCYCVVIWNVLLKNIYIYRKKAYGMWLIYILIYLYIYTRWFYGCVCWSHWTSILAFPHSCNCILESLEKHLFHYRHLNAYVQIKSRELIIQTKNREKTKTFPFKVYIFWWLMILSQLQQQKLLNTCNFVLYL